MSSLSKSDLVKEISDRTESTKAATERFIESFQDVIMEAVAEGKDVRLTGFAAFKPVKRAARMTRNPRTGETVETPEKTVPNIKPLKRFKDMLTN